MVEALVIVMKRFIVRVKVVLSLSSFAGLISVSTYEETNRVCKKLDDGFRREKAEVFRSDTMVLVNTFKLV